MKRLIMVFIILFVFPINKCFSWGHDGHVLVAKIAELGLTDKSKKELAKLGFEHIGTQEVSAWADKIRRNRDYPQYARSGPWHFIDLPINSDIKSVNDVVEFSKDHKPNVVTQIYYFSSILKDKNVSKKDKQDALKFLVHFIGDIHQPLHCADRNDHGGNGLKIHYLGKGGKSLNLHTFWDTNLVKMNVGKRSLDEVAESWYKGFDADYIGEVTEKMTPEEWAYDSYKIAKIDVYKVPIDRNLDIEYVKRNKIIVQQQIEKAGIRLAEVLNNIFSDDK